MTVSSSSSSTTAHCCDWLWAPYNKLAVGCVCGGQSSSSDGIILSGRNICMQLIPQKVWAFDGSMPARLLLQIFRRFYRSYTFSLSSSYYLHSRIREQQRSACRAAVASCPKVSFHTKISCASRLLQQQQQRDLTMWSRTRMPKIISFIALNWWSFSDAAAAALNPEKRSPLQEEDVVLHISVINMALGVCSPSSSGRLYCHPPAPPPLHATWSLNPVFCGSSKVILTATSQRLQFAHLLLYFDKSQTNNDNRITPTACLAALLPRNKLNKYRPVSRLYFNCTGADDHYLPRISQFICIIINTVCTGPWKEEETCSANIIIHQPTKHCRQFVLVL